MTVAEIKIINLLAEAYNMHTKLDVQHTDDQKEFASKIHDLQRIVMSREAVRTHPDLFHNQSLYEHISVQWPKPNTSEGRY